MNEDDKTPNNVKLRAWTDSKHYRNSFWVEKLVCTPQTVAGYMTGKATPNRRTAAAIETITQGAVPADQWGKV